MKVAALLPILIWIWQSQSIGRAPKSNIEPISGTQTCSLPGLISNQIGKIEDADLLRAFNLQASLIHSLHAATMVRGESRVISSVIGKSGRETPATIDLAKPDLIRVAGGFPYISNRGFVMISDGHEFRLLGPNNGQTTFQMGPIDAASHSLTPMPDIRPQALVDALQWQEGSLRSGAVSQPVDATVRVLKVEVGSAQRSVRILSIVFDLRIGVVSSIASYDLGDHLISETSFTEWKQVALPGTASSVGCFPRRIRLEASADQSQLDIRILDLTLNSKIPKSVFRLSPPRGVPVIHLDR